LIGPSSFHFGRPFLFWWNIAKRARSSIYMGGDLAIMKGHKGVSLFYLVVLGYILALSGVRDVTAEEPQKIDLAATVRYVDDWTSRDAFPDSPSFAYQNVYSQLALKGRVDDTAVNRIKEFLKKCQSTDGGFVTSPDMAEGSSVIITYFAIAALDLVDASSTVDREKAVGFILSLVQKDGGIKGTAKDARANLGTTYYGVRAMHLLKAMDRLDKQRTIAYIESHRDDGKGFGVMAGLPSAPQSTFMAVECLELLGGLTDDTMKPGVIEFIKETPYSGLDEPENPALMTMDNMAYILETASILSAVQQLNTEKIYQFVESLFIPENGGFGPTPGYGTTPPSTFSALVCLVKLGKLKDPYSMRGLTPS
jgi:prenyltransferase beta subunit